EARVEVADDRLDALDALAVQLDDQPQDAVRGRVIRPEVDLEDVVVHAEGRVDLEHCRDGARDPGPGVDRCLPACRERHSAPENRTGSTPTGEGSRTRGAP